MYARPDSTTHHAVEAAKHLWMVPYTMMGPTDPDEAFAESIVKDAQHAWRNYDSESFWYFTTGALAYAHIAANAVIGTLADHDNSDEVGELDADLIDEQLEEANHDVTMAVAHWFRGAAFHFQLGEVVHDVSTVNDRPSGFDCTRNTSESVSWFHCAAGDNDRQAPCLNCPAVQRLGTLICRTDLHETIDTILGLAQGERREPDLERLGPLPSPAGPASHCLKAIRNLDELASRFDVGSDKHRGIAYAVLAANDVIRKLHHLGHYAGTDEDTRDIEADADRIAASILSGEPMDEDREFTTPDEYDECVIKHELTTGKTTYDCLPPDVPEDWGLDDLGHDLPCRLCPMKSSAPETAMDRIIRRLAELPENA